MLLRRVLYSLSVVEVGAAWNFFVLSGSPIQDFQPFLPGRDLSSESNSLQVHFSHTETYGNTSLEKSFNDFIGSK